MSVFIETRGDGPPLILLHGWGLNRAVWNSIADTLARQWTLYLIDLPGHGRSTAQALHSIDAMADALGDTLARHLSGPANVLGWSLGGQTALALAQRHPEMVSRLVLVGTTPCFVQQPDWPHAMHPATLEDFAQRLQADFPGTIGSFLALQAMNAPGSRDVVAALQMALHTEGQPAVGNLATGLGILRDSDLRPVIENIRQPALVIQGGRDMLTREPAARWLAQRLPQAEYLLIDDASHAPFLSHPERFHQAVTEFFVS